MDYELEIAQREVGNLPLSIGTSLAVEVIGGGSEETPPSPEREFLPEELWINLRTLFRNLYNGMNPELRRGVLGSHFIPTMLQEIEQIFTYVSDVRQDQTKVIFYHCSYRSMGREFPRAKLKEASTELQRLYAALEYEVCETILKEHKETFDIRTFDIKIIGSSRHAWVMTHAPVDLLWNRSFSKLVLLESHTGALKTRTQWYTKLTNGKELHRIPFNRLSLQIFGDNSTHFLSMPQAFKKPLLELSEQYHWTQATTMEKIRYNISGMSDHFGKQILLEMSR